MYGPERSYMSECVMGFDSSDKVLRRRFVRAMGDGLPDSTCEGSNILHQAVRLHVFKKANRTRAHTSGCFSGST